MKDAGEEFFTVTELMFRWKCNDRKTVIKILRSTPALEAVKLGPRLYRAPAAKVLAWERSNRIALPGAEG